MFNAINQYLSPKMHTWIKPKLDSRFLWLRVVASKAATAVAAVLYEIFTTFGKPRILQVRLTLSIIF